MPVLLLRRVRTWDWVSLFFKCILVYLAVAYALSYFEIFTERQSGILALFAISLYILAKVTVTEHKLEPFTFTVMPKWYLILTEHGLIKPEEWNDFSKQIKDHPFKYNPLRDGFTFTMLSKELAYWNNRNTFISNFKVYAELSDLRDPDPVLPPGPISATTTFGIELTSEGYKLGIQTPKTVKEGREPIALGILPCSVFWGYDHPLEGYDSSKSDRNRKQVVKDMKSTGWALDKFGFLEHKYFSVWHGGI